MSDVKLTLFVTGETPQSREALSNLRDICEKAFSDYTLEVVDIQEHPRQAEEEKIWATPMLIKESPSPQQRVIGNFSREQDVLRGLNLEIDTRQPNE